MCQEEQMKSTKLSLHILKFDASMLCESQTNVTKSFMKQFLQIIKTQLYYLRLQYPVDLCMIIMLFLLCPILHTDPGIRQFQELHAGGAVGGVDVGHL